MTAGKRSLHALVVGGGIGGLSAAIALRRSGHRVTVLEQAPVLGEIGAGIQVAPNATRCLFSLGLQERLERTAVAAQGSVRRRWEDGRVLGEYPLGPAVEERFGAPYWHMHRADLHAALADAALDPAEAGEPIDLRLNTVVAGVEPESGAAAAVVTEDGTRFEGDVVIGADGIHSPVRHSIWGPDEPIDSGDVAYRALVPREAIQASPLLRQIASEPVLTVWLGPDRHIVQYYVRGKSVLNVVGCVPANTAALEGWTGPGDPNDLLDSIEGWDERVRALVGASSAFMCNAIYDRAPLDTWVAGHVALLGDACHPMLPYQAQGAAQAIEDAVVLASSLDEIDDVDAALQAYEAARYERATAVQGASWKNRRLFHLPDGEEQQQRDAALNDQQGDFDSYSWLWSQGPITA
jgi:salicylate hydroxylase